MIAQMNTGAFAKWSSRKPNLAEGIQIIEKKIGSHMLTTIEQTERFLQLNRDTMTEITLLQPDGTGYASANLQLCTAHWYGGDAWSSCENTVEAVSYLLGELPIDGYYALDMQAIPRITFTIA